MNEFVKSEVKLEYPDDVKPNVAYWGNPSTWWSSRRAFRRDNSTAWRRSFPDGVAQSVGRTVPFSELLGREKAREGFRFVVLGDTGEGDRSQYSLVPLIRALEPDWIVINGDVAYPAGRERDFARGFFKPYRNLGIPIWALPGNHEYYSKNKGQTFFQVFCGLRFEAMWRESGLRLVPQPGTYWAVEERQAVIRPTLTVIGIDTGMKGNLDGKGLSKRRDDEQLSWLEGRLRRAEERGASAIVLFHIPALVNGEHVDKVHLDDLHRILARSPAVRLVICGHVHNHQIYSPSDFGRYLASRKARVTGSRPPAYVVSGGGGAYLMGPKPRGEYGPDASFPSEEQWIDHTGRARRFVSGAVGRSFLNRAIGMAYSSLQTDDDSGRYLSLVLVDVTSGCVEARHVFLEDLASLYPTRSRVDVVNGRPPIPRPRIDEILADDRASGREVLRICEKPQ